MITTRRIGYIVLLIFSFVIMGQAQRSSIDGRVVGPNGEGVQDARVFLKNGNLADVAQDLTDSQGNYRFTSLSDGIYYIEVLPLGTGYDKQTLRVELFSLSRRPGGSSEIYRFDFQLHPLRSIEKPLPKKLAETLAFVQEVPPTARQKYKDAQKLLEKDKKTEAHATLREAIEIFPDYYDALDLLGSEYAAGGHSDVAVPIFRQAVDVNPKGWHAYYGLGVAYSNLTMRKEALEALRKSITLNPFSARAYTKLGTELAKEKASIDEAIKSFQKAAELEPIIAAEANLALASIYSGQGKHKEAADALDKYLKDAQDVKNPDAIKEKIKELRKKAPGQ
jgi:tetratricopeptide (TPR) repeat protein